VPAEMLTERMKQALLANDNKPVGAEQTFSVTLMALDAENYELVCTLAEVPVGSNILVNYTRTYMAEGGWAVFTPYKFDGQTIKLTNNYNREELDLTLHGELNSQHLPGEVYYLANGMVSIIVPQLDALTYTWFANAASTEGFVGYADEVLSKAIPPGDGPGKINVMDVEAAVDAQYNTMRLVMVFVYGFITMLTLIGLTNVISTISSNVRSRAREFAILKSVGMTQSGLNNMLNLESILCSVKSLLIGVPLGVASSFLVYRSMISPVEYSYAIPWLPIAQCTLGVFVITWCVTRYSASRLRRNNIVETIRRDSGM
jgi:putative ABC transport system permease protein